MKLKKLAAFLLAAVIALGGCANKLPDTAATYNGGEVSGGMFVFQQLNAANVAYGLLPNPYMQIDELLAQPIEGVTAEQWINNYAVDLVKLNTAISIEAARLGIELDPALIVEIDKQANETWQLEGEAMERMGVTVDDIKQIAKNNLLSNEVFMAYFGENGTDPVSDEEIKKYFVENYRRSLMAVVSLVDPTTGMPLDEESEAAAKAAFADYKSKIANGAQIIDIIALEQQRLNELSGVTDANVELSEAETEVILGKEGSDYPAGLRDMLFDPNAKMNTPLFYEDEQFLIVFDIRDVLRNEADLEGAKTALLSIYKAKDFEDRLLAAADAANFTVIPNLEKEFSVKSLLIKGSTQG